MQVHDVGPRGRHRLREVDGHRGARVEAGHEAHGAGRVRIRIPSPYRQVHRVPVRHLALDDREQVLVGASALGQAVAEMQDARHTR